MEVDIFEGNNEGIKFIKNLFIFFYTNGKFLLNKNN
jgi:hypothetical protein